MLQIVVTIIGRLLGLRRGLYSQIGMPADARQFAGDALRRQDEVHAPGGDGAARHAVILRALDVLGEGDATFAFDGLQPHGSVGGGSGENHADRPITPVCGQRSEKVIDGQVLRHRLPAGHQVERPVRDPHSLVRGDDVDMIRFHRHALFHFRDGHRGGLGEQLGQQALMSGIEMLHQHQRQARIRRQSLEEFPERLEASRRRPHAYDWVRFFRGRWLNRWGVASGSTFRPGFR